MKRSIAEINEKITKGQAVVMTAEELIACVREKGPSRAAREVDVVTAGTFGPMCSSGAYFNLGHSAPKIKIGGGTASLNGVPLYTGFAAVDVVLGATALPDDDPRNQVYPGQFKYGGAHVIEELAAGKDVRLVASAYGTDCYPRKRLETWISLKDVNEAILFNPRNAYQNYNVGVNLSDRMIYTYMGTLKPRLGNANYCSAGQLSPLLKDPLYRTIGVGTRVFLGGGVGYVAWWGTQHHPGVKRSDKGAPLSPAGTLALIGDLKGMTANWLRGTSFVGYGVTLTVGVGVPIPIIDEEACVQAALSDEELFAQVVDYGSAYPQGRKESLGTVSYAQLKSGSIEVKGKKVPTSSLSSYFKAREIADILKRWIGSGKFLLSEPVCALPGPESGYACRPMNERTLS